MRKLIILILIGVLVTACSGKPGSPVTIEANGGQEFKVVAESNRFSGYHWEIVGELDESIVQFISRDCRADGPAHPGSGGSDILIFGAIGAGETTITIGSYHTTGVDFHQP